MAIERLNKTFVDGEVWDSTDINPITSKIDECIDQINLNTDEIETARDGETDLNARINRDLETNSTYRDEAYKWANEDEDTQVTDSANHSGYSAYHYSKKAEASANAAAQSENNAATSESNAAQSESDALAHLNEFKGIYYGSYAEDPETDPNGNPPDAGDYYWNTTRNVHRVYNGSGWEDALSSANNVSYDNTNSGLSATNVQDAVDEVESRVEDIEDGTTTVPNADKVDNFDASQTPQANQIPVLNSSGQLPLPFTQVPILVNGQDMMSREFYVDAVNGDDNNDGSESAPFKTIKKAIDSISIGGAGLIRLANGQTHVIDTYIYSLKKTIQIISLNQTSTQGSPDDDSPIIKFNDDGSNITGHIYFSDGTLVFGGFLNPVIIEVGDGSVELSGTAIFGDKSVLNSDGSSSLTSLQIAHSELRTSGIFAALVTHIRVRKSTVKVLQGDYFSNCQNDILIFAVNESSIVDGSGNDISTSCIKGIVKDSNGVPRNVISNIVL